MSCVVIASRYNQWFRYTRRQLILSAAKQAYMFRSHIRSAKVQGDEFALFVARRLAVLDYVLSTSTNFVLKKYKENGMVLAEEKKDERIIVSA